MARHQIPTASIRCCCAGIALQGAPLHLLQEGCQPAVAP